MEDGSESISSQGKRGLAVSNTTEPHGRQNKDEEAMTINLQKPDITELKPRITVFGVGGGGGNAVNNMINANLDGVDFVVANTDAQALGMNKAERVIQMGVAVTEGLGAGSQPEIGRAAAEECIDEINDHLSGVHMAFVTAGMGGGTGTGAAPVVARAAREKGILTVGVVTKPFSFEGQRRMKTAELGIEELQDCVDTLIVIPNQNLFRIANDKTTFADAFAMADQVLYSGVACITDLMVKEGLINLDFADVRSVMREMGRAMMGTGEASGEGRAMNAAEAAIANPLLDETSMAGANGLLISITGGRDMTLFEVDEAATRIREEVDSDANIILGATFDESLEGIIRVSVVATGIDKTAEGVVMPARTQSNESVPRATQTIAAPRISTPAPAASPLMHEQKIEKELEIAKPVVVASDPKVSIAPFQPENAIFSEPVSEDDFAAQLEAQLDLSKPPQVPVAETVFESPKMPKVEDFPPIARQSMSGATIPEERGPMGLLKRIANGLGAHEKEVDVAPQAETTQPVIPAPHQPVAREDNNPYAPPRSVGVDQHGRPAPVAPATQEDDQLDIPAFLRRQSS